MKQHIVLYGSRENSNKSYKQCLDRFHQITPKGIVWAACLQRSRSSSGSVTVFTQDALRQSVQLYCRSPAFKGQNVITVIMCLKCMKI